MQYRPSGISFSSMLPSDMVGRVSVGDVVHVSYTYLLRGKPVDPEISTVDEEITWEGIILGNDSVPKVSSAPRMKIFISYLF